MLRAALRRSVIAADPAGAEERRKEAERQSQVVLYPDQDCTATLAGQRLSAVHATAAMARIKAMARALKASGTGGSIDLLCAQIYIGLLLGTLPLIPPAEGAPPDSPPGTGPGGDPGDDPGGDAGSGPPDDPDSGPGDDPGAGHAQDPGAFPPAGRGEDPPGGPDGSTGRDRNHGAARHGAGRPGTRPDGSRAGDSPAGDDPAGEVPPPGDQDAPRDDDNFPGAGPAQDPPGWYSDADHDDDGWPAPDWPALPALIPPAFTRPGTP